jgi:hypothetical protein
MSSARKIVGNDRTTSTELLVGKISQIEGSAQICPEPWLGRRHCHEPGISGLVEIVVGHSAVQPIGTQLRYLDLHLAACVPQGQHEHRAIRDGDVEVLCPPRLSARQERGLDGHHARQTASREVGERGAQHGGLTSIGEACER